MSNELMRPIDPETARAIEEAAKLGGKLVDAGTKAGGYIDRVIGRLPDNIVGLVLGDWVLHKRIRRWAELQAETEEILGRHGVKEPFADVSPAIAVPLIEAAVNESREGVKQMWARLLAAAMDPERTQLVRQSFIRAIKEMDPLDAQILDWIYQSGAAGQQDENQVAHRLQVTRDEVGVSLENLHKIGCIVNPPSLGSSPPSQPISLSAFGRELMRVCRG
jgi:Abortive infection alpha